MSKKLFVGGLDWSTTDQALRQAFEEFGSIEEAKVITDRESGRSRGFGFVTFGDSNEALTAISAMNGKDIGGRAVRVNEAESKPNNGGGGGGGARRW